MSFKFWFEYRSAIQSLDKLGLHDGLTSIYKQRAIHLV